MQLRVLVLDQSYFPHRIVSWHKAIKLLLGDKVEIVEEYDAYVATVNTRFKIPAVVRLLMRIPNKQRAIRFSRANLLARDGRECQYCGTSLNIRGFTYDHVIPRQRAKKEFGLRDNQITTWTNVVAACQPCNLRKGNRTPWEAGMILKCEPKRPEWLPIVTFQQDAAGQVPELWVPYIWI